MSSRARTPNTPFIPPLTTPDLDASPPPVIPSAPRTPNQGASSLPQQGQYLYQPAGYYSSPYVPSLAFIPPGAASLDGNSPPPVIPGYNTGPLNRQPVVSSDYTGYPAGGPPFSPPQSAPIQPGSSQVPPHLIGQMFSPYAQSAYLPPGAPWSAPAHFSTFPGAQWATPAPHHAHPGMTPWVQQQHRPLNTYTPGYGTNMNLPPTGPSPHQPAPQGLPPGQPSWIQNSYYEQGPSWGQHPHQSFGQAGGYFGQQQPVGPPPPPRVAPDSTDRMPPFTKGPNYGPVLDPFLVRVSQIQLRLNPLLAPPADDSSKQPYLKWNMLFPSSYVLRSDDKHSVSWSNGRDTPATFPRVTSLQLVSEHVPWMITVEASDPSIGVTCGEVIDQIARELNKRASQVDFSRLPPRDKQEVAAAYKHHRSRSAGVPGGSLGDGLKRMDFLKKNVNYGGIIFDERLVRKIVGENLPCTFIVRGEQMSQMEAEEQEQAARVALRAGSARSRANSVNSRITVVSPSESYSDEVSVDRA